MGEQPGGPGARGSAADGDSLEDDLVELDLLLAEALGRPVALRDAIVGGC